jgi:hypothetical protein
MDVEDRFLRRPETSSEARFVSRSRYSLAMHSTKDNYSVSLDNLARPVHQPKQPETIRLLRYYESRRMGPSMEKGRQLRGNRTKEDCVLDEGAIIPPRADPQPTDILFLPLPRDRSSTPVLNTLGCRHNLYLVFLVFASRPLLQLLPYFFSCCRLFSLVSCLE